jgi:hypothetical protein
MRTGRACPAPIGRSVFAGFRFPPEVIVLAVRWYCASGCPTATSKRCSSNAASRSTTSASTAGCSGSRRCWPRPPGLAGIVSGPLAGGPGRGEGRRPVAVRVRGGRPVRPGRAAALGFAEVRAYLVDRPIEREWLLVDVAAELGAHRGTVRRLMAQVGVKRHRRTARQVAAGERGRRVQLASWQTRRAERLAKLGFQDLAACCSAASWSRAGRSGGCGGSFGLAVAGWSPSWHGWACGIDAGQGQARGSHALVLPSVLPLVLPSEAAPGVPLPTVLGAAPG